MPNPPVAREWPSESIVNAVGAEVFGIRVLRGDGLVANTGQPQESREFCELPGLLSLQRGPAPE